MKRQILKYMLIGATVLGTATSCNDSFLERNPTHDLNNNTFWNTASDLQAYCNGIYNEAASNGTYKFLIGFNSDSWSVKVSGPFTFEAMSDNFATMDGSQVWASAVAAGIENVPSGNTSYASWSWTLLRRINVFLENYNRATGVAEEIRNRYAGEALFFRAWFYLYMVENYGGVPLITKSLDTESPELYAPRNTREECMAQVLEDINHAIDYLPASEWGDNRVTKGAALALKSRICLFEGTFRKYHGINGAEQFLNECVDASEKCMNLGYEIYNTGNPKKDYTALFTTDDLSKNKEVILYRKYEDPVHCHRMCGYTVNLRNGGTKDFVDDYLCIDHDGKARPVALSEDYSNDTPELEFTNRDPRLSQTFLAPGYVPNEYTDKGADGLDADGNETPAKQLFEDANNGKYSFPRLGNMKTWPSLTGYHSIKYYIREQDRKGFGKETQDYPLFRYAEVLLNLAEAKDCLGQCDQSVLDKTVNVLRDRAGMPHLEIAGLQMDPKYASYGLPALTIEIRRERRVELSFEFLRYYDLMRWAWGDKLKERVLGIRMEDKDFDDPRYGGALTKGGSSTAGSNPVYVFKAADGKQYVDPYEGTNYATSRRSFDPNKDYLRPIPKSAITNNTNIEQNPGWD